MAYKVGVSSLASKEKEKEKEKNTQNEH